MIAPLGRDLGLVGVGGALGSLGRYGVAVVLPHGPTGLPVATLLVNASGCLLLGLLVASRPRQSWVRPFAGSGLLGGFTTFSAFALETDRLLLTSPVMAAAYLGLTVLLGLAAARAGLALGAARGARRAPTPREVPG